MHFLAYVNMQIQGLLTVNCCVEKEKETNYNELTDVREYSGKSVSPVGC